MTRRQKARPNLKVRRSNTDDVDVFACRPRSTAAHPLSSRLAGRQDNVHVRRPKENRSDSAKKAGKPSKGQGGQRALGKGRAPGARSEGKTQPRGSCARQRLAGAARASQRKAAKQQRLPRARAAPRRQSIEVPQKGGGRVGQCAHRHRLKGCALELCAMEAKGQQLHQCRLQVGQGPEIWQWQGEKRKEEGWCA